MSLRPIGVVAALTVASAASRAQRGAVVGSVVVKDAETPLTFAMVAAPVLKREQLTNDRGVFRLLDLEPGPVAIRIKQIGFVPFDTIVIVRPGDTTRVRFAMRRIPIQLSELRISAATCARSKKASDDAMLAPLFDQVRLNAERSRVLATTHPFVWTVQRLYGPRQPNGVMATPKTDTVKRTSRAEAIYAPGGVVRIEQTPFGGQPVVVIPELVDFADTAFSATHCFSYDGEEKMDGVKVVRVNFDPVATVTTPDIRGTIRLRSSDFQIVRSDMELTTVSPEMKASGVRSVQVRIDFKESVPGLPMIDKAESITIYGDNRKRPTADRQTTLSISWTNGPP